MNLQSSASSSSWKATSTMNIASQHPLPARPDWAIQSKHYPNPRNTSTAPSPISSPRSMSSCNGVQGNHSSRQYPLHSPSHAPPLSLQSTDFPPLTSPSASMPPSFEQRRPTGAWGSSAPRPIFRQPSNVGLNSISNVNDRLDETGFERPPPKVCFFKPNDSLFTDGRQSQQNFTIRRHPNGVL